MDNNLQDILNLILNEIKSINKNIDDIKQTQIELNKKLDEMDTNLDSINISTNNMDNHISFVENVYDTVKSPFYFILNKITKIDNIPEKNLIKES